MTKERRLGRGLEALLGRVASQTQEPPPASTNPADPGQGASPPSAPRAAEPGPTVHQLYGGFVSAYEPPPPQPRKTSLPGMDSVTRCFATIGSPHQPPDKRPDASARETSVEPAHADLREDTCSAAPVRVAIQQVESNPFQPRHDFEEDELQSLCDSLRAHGLLQPIVVRPAGDRYQVVAGERRLRAALKAGWNEVPVRVVQADDRQTAELAIVENLQRKDLNPLEKALSFQRYLQQFGSTQEELAARLKLDRSTISNFIRLLELPEEVQQALRRGKISQGHARSLLPLGDEREQVAFCRRIQQEGLSVRQTEALVQQTIQQADAEPLGLVGRDGSKSSAPRPTSAQLAALEQQFRAALGTRVKITQTARGRGRLVIQFSSHEEFERIRQQICGPARPETRSQAG
ncbi:MAG: ParB/RepB/Spo0J family partition protein [Thermoguttaceae bacterium]